jgi:choline dehydrogenase
MSQYSNTTNQITEGSVAYLDIFQVLGQEQGEAAAQDLLNTVSERAEEIVASGGFTSVSGLEKILTEQAESMLYRNGSS